MSAQEQYIKLRAWLRRHVTLSYQDNSFEHRLGIDLSITGKLREWIDSYGLHRVRAAQRAAYKRQLEAMGVHSKFFREGVAGQYDIWQEKSPGKWWDDLPSSGSPRLVRRQIDDEERAREITMLRHEADAEHKSLYGYLPLSTQLEVRDERRPVLRAGRPPAY